MRRLTSEDRKAKVDRIHIAEYSVSQRIRGKKKKRMGFTDLERVSLEILNTD